MVKQFVVTLIAVICFIACGKNENKKNEETTDSILEGNKVIAYVMGGNNNWGENNEKVLQITHINYAFANIQDGKVVEGYATDVENLKKLNQLKEVNKDLKILISVGGWGWSKNFSDAVLTENSREIFAQSAVDFMLKHKIDGIDLDWEYPGQKGDNNKFRPEDKENFTAVLKLLREKLDVISNTKNQYLLTIATAANQQYLNHTNMREAHQYLDFINIMTYDFYTGGSNRTGHHANLFKSEFDENNNANASKAVDEHVNAGIPIEKLVLGVPFYGRWWKGTHPNNNGLYQNSTGKRGSLNYKSIADSLSHKKFISYWDDKAQAPYIWRDKDSLFLTYENVMSLKKKVDYVNSKKMGGIMFWQFNGDNGELLNTISEHLLKK
jgi:chitinase